MTNDVTAIRSTEARRVASRLLDVARGLGLERGLRTALTLVYEQWRVLQGDAPWIADSDRGPLLFAPSSFMLNDHPDGDRLYAAISEELELFNGVGDDALLVLVYEELLSRLETEVRGGGESSTPRSIAQLMARALGRPTSVIDPACGFGNVLAMCSTLFSGARLTGMDIDEANVEIATHRFEMGHGRRTAQFVSGDLFEVGCGHLHRYDGAVLQPPWGLLRRQGAVLNWSSLGLDASRLPKGSTRTDLGWLDVARRFLAPEGRAAVLLPRLPGGGLHEQAIDRLLSLGVIEAVIAFPQNVVGSTSIAANLVVVCGDGLADAAAPILFADAGALELTDGRGGVRELTGDAIDTLSRLVRTHRSGHPLGVEAYVAALVPPAEVLPARGLQPQLYLPECPSSGEGVSDPSAHLLSQVRIGGLKAFAAPKAVDLAPLTLVYGANSAGKSSLIQSLLLLKQSVEAEGLVTQGDLANVGSFMGVSHRHEGGPIELGLTFGALTWALPGSTADPALPREVALVFVAGSGGRGRLEKAELRMGPHPLVFEAALDARSLAVRPAELGTLIEHLADLEYPPRPLRTHRRPGHNGLDQRAARLARTAYETAGLDAVRVARQGLLPTGDVEPERMLAATLGEADFTLISDRVRRVAAVAAGVSAEARALLHSVTYLGPLRSAPQRFYDRAAANGVPGDGRDVAVFLFDNSTVVGHVNDWLKRLEIPYSLDVVPVYATGASDVLGDIVAMPLTDLRSGVTVSPADVGFGISQVLPIVVELTARQESVICVEQPETHLHPRLQARLGDLFIDAVNPAGRRNQLIVETHSEHLMLRVQRRIREGAISPDQIALLYVDQDQDGNAVVQRLRLDEDGDFLDEWPSGFFDERLDELFGGLG